MEVMRKERGSDGGGSQFRKKLLVGNSGHGSLVVWRGPRRLLSLSLFLFLSLCLCFSVCVCVWMSSVCVSLMLQEEEEEAECLKRVVYTVLCILGFVVLSLDFPSCLLHAGSELRVSWSASSGVHVAASASLTFVISTPAPPAAILVWNLVL
jgi:hypothetical protein